MSEEKGLKFVGEDKDGNAKPVSLETDGDGKHIMRVVDAAPFAYDEPTDSYKIKPLTKRTRVDYQLSPATISEGTESLEIINIGDIDKIISLKKLVIICDDRYLGFRFRFKTDGSENRLAILGSSNAATSRRFMDFNEIYELGSDLLRTNETSDNKYIISFSPIEGINGLEVELYHTASGRGDIQYSYSCVWTETGV